MVSSGAPTDSNRAADQNITLRIPRNRPLDEMSLASRAEQCVPIAAGWLASHCRGCGLALPMNILVFTLSLTVTVSFLTIDTAELSETCRKSALDLGVSAQI